MKFAVGITTGTFDCLHAGHHWFLNRAAEFVERLVVLTGTEDWIARFKGRPPVDAFDVRAAKIRAACPKVCEVQQIEDDGPLNLEYWTKTYVPDVLLFCEDQLHIPDKLKAACLYSVPVLIFAAQSDGDFDDRNQKVDGMTPFTADKMFLHAERIAQWQAGILPPPVTVELDLTNNCNHSCGGCTFSHLINVDNVSIPFELALSIVKQLGELGVKGLTFSGGGEPLVYGESRVIWLMSQAKDSGIDTALITNGSLLRSERFLELCQWIRVSLDGYDAETFAKFHGRSEGEFEKVCGNLRAMAAARPRYDCTLGAGFLTDAGSLARGDFDKMARFCAQEFPGLDYLQFRPLVLSMHADASLQGGGLLSQESLAQLTEAYQRARQAHSRSDYRVLWSQDKYLALAQPNAGRVYDKCHAHFTQATISADCRVYICCHTQGEERFCLGDLKENTFAEIWHSDKAREVFERTDPRVHCPAACRLHSQNLALHNLAQAEHGNFI